MAERRVVFPALSRPKSRIEYSGLDVRSKELCY